VQGATEAIDAKQLASAKLLNMIAEIKFFCNSFIF